MNIHLRKFSLSYYSRFTVLLFLCHKGTAKVRNFPVKREIIKLMMSRQLLKFARRYFRGQQVYSSLWFFIHLIVPLAVAEGTCIRQ